MVAERGPARHGSRPAAGSPCAACEVRDLAICGAMIRADIADFLGLTTETVSRTLTQLKTAGTIRLLENSRVLLADLDELSTLAGGG